MENFNSILFHKSGPANKYDTYLTFAWTEMFLNADGLEAFRAGD